MSYNTIILDIKNAIATLTFNRPDRLNSFTVEMHSEVADAISKIEEDSAIRVLVITGAGRGFCAGQDLSDRAVAPSSEKPDLGESLENRYNPLIRKITGLKKPVICAVNGVAAGAGANIALACDIVIAKQSAKFIQSFANIGLVPDSGGTWNLPRLIGQARALGLALTGEPINAEKAMQWGMIWKAVEDDQFEAEVTQLAEKFSAAPTQGIAAIKKAIREAHIHSLDQQLDVERDMQRSLGKTHDYQEGVSAFMEKRDPQFTGQ